METIEEKFASNLKALRNKIGMSQAELAERAGVSVQTIWRAENNTLPQGPNIEKLAEALGVRPRDFFNDMSADGNMIGGNLDPAELEQVLGRIMRRVVMQVRSDSLHNELNESLAGLTDEQLKQVIFIAKAFKESSTNQNRG